MNFGPLIGGTPAHAVNIFSEQRFPVTRNKIDFPRNFEIQYTNKQMGTRNIYKQEAKLTNYGVLSNL